MCMGKEGSVICKNGEIGLADRLGKASFCLSAFKKEGKMVDGAGGLTSWIITLASALFSSHRVVGKYLEPYQSFAVKITNSIFVLATSSGPGCSFTKMGPKVLFPLTQTRAGTSAALHTIDG